MRRIHAFLAALAAGVVAGAATSATAAGAPATVSHSRSRATLTSLRQASPPKVFLITGNRVILTVKDGLHLYAATPAPGHGSAPGEVLIINAHRTTYVIPATALPYLGRQLDPRLFDVATLLRAEHDGRLRVRIGYRGALPTLPGVTLTSHGGDSATGYLTRTSSPALGAALVRQFVADAAHRGNARYSTRDILSAGTTISIPGAASGVPTRREYVMHTVTVAALDERGRPANDGSVLLWNTDAGIRTPFLAVFSFFNGVAKASVPSGDYSAIASFATEAATPTGNAHRDGNGKMLWNFRVVVVPDFKVAHDATVHVDARIATSAVTMVTPRPAQVVANDFSLYRVSKDGSALGFDLLVYPGSLIRVAPTSHPAKVGQLFSGVRAVLASPSGSGLPYVYNLAYASSGIIPKEHYVVGQQTLATVDASYFSDVASAGMRVQTGIFPYELRYGLGSAEIEYPISLPRREIEYDTGDPSILWVGFLTRTTAANGTQILQIEDDNSYLPGQEVTESWDRYPLHPAGNLSLLGASDPVPTILPVTRAGNILTIKQLFPFSDNQAGHRGYLNSTDSGSWEVDQNGVEVAEGDVPKSSVWQAKLGPKPSTVQLTLDTARTGGGFELSTRSQTVWTWQSAFVGKPATIPKNWACPVSLGGSAPNRHCAAEPLLTLNYAVAGLALDGSVAPGLQTLGISVGHLQLASAAKISGMSVQVSYDDGATWQDASVTGKADAGFRATFQTPATANDVTLRVSAGDTAGDGVTETIVHAYKLG